MGLLHLRARQGRVAARTGGRDGEADGPQDVVMGCPWLLSKERCQGLRTGQVLVPLVELEQGGGTGLGIMCSLGQVGRSKYELEASSLGL